MHSVTPRKGRAARRALAATTILLTAFSLFGPVSPARAVTGEGDITYNNADEINTKGTPNINPFATKENGVNPVSGSKEASPLDANGQSKVKFSFPSSDYEDSYDIVLVVDATTSFAAVAPQAKNFLQSVSQQLVGRGAVVNVGVVSYSTVSYTSFTPGPTSGSGAMCVILSNCTNWDLFTLAATTGAWNLAPPSMVNQIPEEYRPLISALTAVSGFPGSTMATNGKAQTYRYLLGDLTSGLRSVTASNYNSLYNTMASAGSALAIETLLTTGAYTNGGAYPHTPTDLYNQLGYKMTDPVIGTNLEAGLKAGQALLDKGTAPGGNKYLVFLGDGGSYYWNGPTDDPADATSNATFNTATSSVNWGQASFDWSMAGIISAGYAGNYARFLAEQTADTDTGSQLSIAQWNDFWKTPSQFDASSALASSYSDPVYKYTSQEKGTAHAARALEKIVADNPGERVIMLGFEYNPQWAGGPGSPYQIAKDWRQWAASKVDTAYEIGTDTQADDISAAFNDIVNRLKHAFESGTLTDTIGSQFHLVQGGSALAASDVSLTLNGVELPGVPDASNPNIINFGTPDEMGKYPYVLEYTAGPPEKLVLHINVPIIPSEPLQFGYTLQLDRQTSPGGWHNNVVLNESAGVEYVDTDGNPGSATFPVPATRYFVPFKVIYDLQYEVDGSHAYVGDTTPEWGSTPEGVPYLIVNDEGKTIPNPQPTREGYTFGGWYTDKECTIAWDFDTVVTEDMTLYAKWTADVVTPPVEPPVNPPVVPPVTPPGPPPTGGYLAGSSAWLFWLAGGLVVVAAGLSSVIVVRRHRGQTEAVTTTN